MNKIGKSLIGAGVFALTLTAMVYNGSLSSNADVDPHITTEEETTPDYSGNEQTNPNAPVVGKTYTLDKSKRQNEYKIGTSGEFSGTETVTFQGENYKLEVKGNVIEHKADGEFRVINPTGTHEATGTFENTPFLVDDKNLQVRVSPIKGFVKKLVANENNFTPIPADATDEEAMNLCSSCFIGTDGAVWVNLQLGETLFIKIPLAYLSPAMQSLLTSN